MKTLRNILYVLLVSILAVSCTRDYETPPFTEPSYNGNSNITIAEFRAKYANASTTPTAIESGLVLKATVVGNDVSGNIYKNLYLQDETGGIVVYINQSDIYADYQLGQQVFLSMNGLYVVTYGGELEIEGNGAAVPWNTFTTNASLNGWPDTTRFKPNVVKFSDLNGNASKLMNTLVEFDSVYFANGGIEQFAVSSDGKSTAVNQTIKDKTDTSSIVVRTSTYADFATDTLPKGYGKLVGILSRFKSNSGVTTWQLTLRSKKDVKDFTGVAVNNGAGASGAGTKASPYDVAGALAKQGASAFVTGYIVGNVDGTGMSISTESKFASPFTISTNILLADSPTETKYAKCIPVQLPTGVVRTGLNLVDNPSLLGTKVTVYGSLETYFTVSGMKSTSYYILASGTTGGTEPVTDAILNETLLTQTSYDKFTAYSVAGSQVWAFSSSYGAKMTGYDSASKTNNANEDWLISPALDLSSKTSATLSFDQTGKFFGTMLSEATLWVSTNYSSGAPSTATWTPVSIPTYMTGSDYNFVNSGAISLATYLGKSNVRFAFKYLSSASAAGTWEVKNVLVK